MNGYSKWLLTLGLVLQVHALSADDLQYRMQGGGTVRVDPETNRATVTRNGVTTPLWDGTHRMKDGSILIINRGIAVPDEKVLESRKLPLPEAEEWQGAPIAGYSPCEKLVRHVCGRKKECGSSEGCDLARQLLDMEEEERAAQEDRYRMTYTSGRCMNVRKDLQLFPPCTPADRRRGKASNP